MIASLRGKLIFTDNQTIVVECSGVGFKCMSSLKTIASLPSVGNDVFVHTYLSVREDALDMYAFSTTDELECFKLVTSVNGLGAKMAIALLSEFTPDQISFFILSGDAKALTRASGIGPKLAQRMVLELKDKISKGAVTLSDDNILVQSTGKTQNSSEAIAALVALGFSQSEATSAVSKLDQTLSTDELIRGGLKNLSR
ncbi:MAG: Holliday junction branch migration protein RuvA [Ruminococcaceae bacterium]|nr:Holliday junction branch migration protein RuvA [Oscillospiraceae bacterium]